MDRDAQALGPLSLSTGCLGAGGAELGRMSVFGLLGPLT